MINEKVSVRDFKEFETDIRGIGLVEDLLGNLSQTELRYYYEENTELTLSLDNIKTVLTKYAVNTGNNRGISIINIRFNPGNYVIAILRREGQSLSAIVYAASSSVLLPYLLYYSGGTWTEHLLASGRVSLQNPGTAKALPHNAWTTIDNISLPVGVWGVSCEIIFPTGNTTGTRGMLLTSSQDGTAPVYGRHYGAPSPNSMTVYNTYSIAIVNTETNFYNKAFQNSGAEITGVSGSIKAFRLS